MAPVLTGSRLKATDGGWGWAVCVASFFLQLLSVGVVYTFGIIFVEFLDVFGESESKTAWIGSIQSCLLYFTGIIGGPLIEKFGWRPVTICGSFISASGFLLSALSPNIYTLYFTYGVLTGIGNGLMYVTSMVAVQHYFDTKRAMATGIAVSGGGLGTVIFAFTIRNLLDAVGWRWTLVIEASMMATGIFFGAFFRPLPPSSGRPSQDHLRDDQDETKKAGEPPAENGSAITPRDSNGNSLKVDLSHSDSHYQITESRLASSLEQSRDDDDDDENEIALDQKAQQEVFCCCSCRMPSNSICYPALLTDPVFILMCLAVAFFCFGYHVPYTYVPERAQKAFGVDARMSSALISVMGVSNVVSRLVFGWFGNRSTLIRFVLAGIMLILGGAVSVLMFLFTTYPLMIVYSILYGTFTGCWTSLFPVILVDLLGIEMIEKTLGQSLAAGSLAFLVASPLVGFIVDTTGNFNLAFAVVGLVGVTGGVLFFCILCIKRRTVYVEIPGEDIPAHYKRRRSHISESFA